MGFIEELWLIPKTGKHRGRPRFLKKINVDDISRVQSGNILRLVGKTGHERRYQIMKIEHAIYQVPKEKYNESGTEYFARIFVERF